MSRKAIASITIAVLILATYNVFADSFIDASCGFPRGYMKFSGNLAIGKSFGPNKLFSPEVIIQESFSTRPNAVGERASLWVSTIYLFGSRRYVINPDYAVFIKSGGGLHLVWTRSNLEWLYEDVNRAEFRVKWHLIPGIAYYLSDHSSMLSYIRFTVPSHLILDSYYLGIQFKL